MAVIDRERWSILEPLLDEVLELEPESRAPWLAALTNSAPDIAADLNALLAGEASADRDHFLARPLELALQGWQVGAYTLERPLGDGGMGSVWLATRSDGRFEGHAAVKLLNLSLLGAAGRERFRREGSMLARLAHPGIARLLDAGVTGTQQPYLVLEYVDGQHLDAWANGHRLTTEQRIALFTRVLDAVSHAHANLIVHRDLKPSNILVTDDGNVKLLDFGIASFVADEGHAAAPTVEGARPLTPHFAAPEQVRGETVTTATDIYSLGVILYMLLSGRHPTAEGLTTREAVERATLEVSAARLSPRDLGNIMDKALRKDPADRYQNVDAFATDLRRFLRHEPVSAAPDPLAYRARKYVRRHRAAVAIGVLLLGVLVSATGLSLSQRREAERQRDVAVAATKRANAQADFAALVMEQVGNQPLTAREILDRARDGMERQFSADSGFLVSALVQLSDRYAQLDEVPVRATLLARAESIATAMHDTTQLAEVRCNIGDNMRLQGRQEDSERAISDGLALLRRAPDANAEASCLLFRTMLANERSKPEVSAPAIYRALAIRDSVGERRDMFYVSLLDQLGYTLDRQDRWREGLAAKAHAIALMDSIGRGETVTSALLRHNYAMTHLRLGESAQAESVFHDVLKRLSRSDPSGRYPMQPLIHYAHAALYQGMADSARKYFALLAEEGVADRNRYWEGRALFGLAQAELMLGDKPAARATIERFRKLASTTSLTRSDDQVVNVSTLDALVALSGGDTLKGNALIHETLRKYGYFDGKRSGTLHSTLILAARTALALGHADSALVFARDARATARRDSLSDSRSARVGETWLMEAMVELQRGNRTAARSAVERAVTALRASAGVVNPRTREAERLLGEVR